MRGRPVVLACVLVLALGCSRAIPPGPSITLATTTSTQDSGLLDVLVPTFRRQTGVEVKVVAVGTGQALQLGGRGDADVLLVHDRASEEKFMAQGHGLSRREVMYNDFILVGPGDDPAHVAGLKSATEALTRIARRGAPFVSRGDESGTHQKERELWRLAGIPPEGAWYVRAGAGMGAVLRMADQKRAYTLSDRATFLAQRGGLGLSLLTEGDPCLTNQYSVIVVSPEQHPGVHAAAAQQFADFLFSPEGREVIATFGKDRFGQALFFPGAAARPAGVSGAAGGEGP